MEAVGAEYALGRRRRQPESVPSAIIPSTAKRFPMPSPAPRRRPAWHVYMLRCRDGSLYTGITNDLDRRLKTHSAGRASRYTRSRLPVALVYRERQPTKSRALRREAAIKKLDRLRKERLLEPAATRP